MGDPLAGGLSFFNVGGPAVKLAWLGSHSMHLYAAFATLHGHFGGYQLIGYEDLGLAAEHLPGASTETLLLMACDVDGDWWDCVSDQLVGRDGAGYLTKRLTDTGLGDFAGRALQVTRLDA